VRKDAANMVKENVSTKSLRSGFATVTTVHKVCQSERNAQGGWTECSTVPDRHHAKPMHNRGGFPLMGQLVGDRDRVGTLELQRMLPAETTRTTGA
jgi:hypothetical protein